MNSHVFFAPQQNGLFIHEKAAFIHLQQQTNDTQLKVNPEQQHVTNFSLKNIWRSLQRKCKKDM